MRGDFAQTLEGGWGTERDGGWLDLLTAARSGWRRMEQGRRGVSSEAADEEEVGV